MSPLPDSAKKLPQRLAANQQHLLPDGLLDPVNRLLLTDRSKNEFL
jgi:hypothetical protein